MGARRMSSTWPVPGGVRVLKIEKLLHQPEAAARPRREVES